MWNSDTKNVSFVFRCNVYCKHIKYKKISPNTDKYKKMMSKGLPISHTEPFRGDGALSFRAVGLEEWFSDFAKQPFKLFSQPYLCINRYSREHLQ